MRRAVFLTLAAVTLCSLATPALAQQTPTFLNGIVGTYQSATSTWIHNGLTVAAGIFGALVTLEITWSLLEAFLGSGDIHAFLGSLIKRIVAIGVAVFIFDNGGEIVSALLADFLKIGTAIAGGNITTPTPDDVFGQGFQIAQVIMASTAGDVAFGPLASIAALPQMLASLLVLAAYGIVAAQLMLTEIQIDIVVGIGAFLLGFLGSRWTMPFAEAYPRMVLASGVKLITIIAIVGLGNSLFLNFSRAASAPGASPVQFLSIGVSTLIYALIAWNLPSIMQMLSGASPVFSAGALAASAAGAAMSAARMAGSGGAGAAGAAGGGGSSAVAAIEKATRTE